MKKISLKSHQRKWSMTISLIAALLFLSGFIFSLLYRYDKEVTTAVGTYKRNSTIAADVVINGSSLYNKRNLTLGDCYIKKYVDALNLQLTYTMESDQKTDISGELGAQAILTASTINEDILWYKTYTILPSKEVKESGKTCKLQWDSTLRLQEYEQLAEGIRSESHVSATVTLRIVLKGDLKLTMGGQQSTDSVESYLEFPLSDEVFSITGEPQQQQTKTVERTETKQMKADFWMLAVLATLAGMSLLVWLGLLFLTVPLAVDTLLAQKKKILNQYGDRIVMVRDIRLPGEVFTVQSFRDLLLLSDELKSPILFCYIQDTSPDFYVIQDRAYVYRLSSQDRQVEPQSARETVHI